MYTIIKEQSVRLTLETNISLTLATEPKIVFKKPDGTTGSWSGTIDGTTVWYDAESKEINQVGWWYVHVEIKLGGDINPHYGKRATFLVKDLYKV